uniref:Uncharacterized protein n=1 Tax=Cacopsylla melanoneura TaxID=428564 RepID=A0A8D9EV99_9HEMI
MERPIIHNTNNINSRDNSASNTRDSRPKSGRGTRRKKDDVEAGKQYKETGQGADVRDIRELLTHVKDDVVTGSANQQDSGIYTIRTGPDVYKPSPHNSSPTHLEHKTFIQHRTGFIETPSSNEKNILEFDEKTLCSER